MIIYYSALLEGGPENQGVTVLVAFYILRRDHERVNGCSHTMQPHINPAHQVKGIAPFLDDEQVEAAVANHVAACS